MGFADGGAAKAWAACLKAGLPGRPQKELPCFWHCCVVQRGGRSQCRQDAAKCHWAHTVKAADKDTCNGVLIKIRAAAAAGILDGLVDQLD